ncbi:hypothetical protein Aple_036460 [Acrocarpospora pleiomorpha]|uniref:Cupin n=1 Tax=Acrocarpospora pleiomorpha TaxID=90975 RepID=A0A5M3XIH2_9ACTN|nr:hypothetical protein [Acrocarpospora pleiomorpha]GES20750.1 hypothetical protein Aple_036460 [Acrocarpospora pleiomorpha]
MSEQTYSPAVGGVILYENARVRVWEMTLQPGGQCEFHQHHNDHIILYPQDGTLQGQEAGDADWGIITEPVPGFVLFRTVGTTAPLPPHRLRNIGDSPVVHYIIELLEKSPSIESQPYEHNDRGRFELPSRTD